MIKTIKGKAQTDGVQELTFDRSLGEPEKLSNHQIQVTVFDSSGVATVPTAGTLEVKVKSPEATEFEPVTDGVIDLTTRDNWLQNLPANAVELEFTPTALDVDKTYDVVVTST